MLLSDFPHEFYELFPDRSPHGQPRYLKPHHRLRADCGVLAIESPRSNRPLKFTLHLLKKYHKKHQLHSAKQFLGLPQTNNCFQHFSQAYI
jgi:hypothetical protein